MPSWELQVQDEELIASQTTEPAGVLLSDILWRSNDSKIKHSLVPCGDQNGPRKGESIESELPHTWCLPQLCIKPPSTRTTLGYIEGSRKLSASVTGKKLMGSLYMSYFFNQRKKKVKRIHDSINERWSVVRWSLLFPSQKGSDGN